MEKVLKLENDELVVSISTKGAELKSILCKKNNTEYLWQADAKWWGKTAPILFPRINLEETALTKLISIPKHGFTRDHHFEVVTIKDQLLTLSQNENMIEGLEFPFYFVCSLELNERAVKVNYNISAAFEFMIGSHPAFNIDLNSTSLFFDNEIFYKLKDGRIDKTQAFKKSEKFLALNSSTFKEDALIFENNFAKNTIKINDSISLCHDSEYLGLWSPPEAPFVCIEPWYFSTKGRREFSYTLQFS